MMDVHGAMVLCFTLAVFAGQKTVPWKHVSGNTYLLVNKISAI
jgi:hypothetical protein